MNPTLREDWRSERDWRRPWRDKPGFSGCCCGGGTTSYHIRQYVNDSGMSVIGQVSTNRTCLGLMWDGTNLVSVYNSGSGPFVRSITYDSSLATVEQIDNTYNMPGAGNPPRLRSVFRCGDGTYCMSSTRTVATNRNAATSVNADDSLDWETAHDVGTGSILTSSVVGDSSGNVYLASTDSGVANTAYVTKFDNTGVKQWKSSVALGASGTVDRLITISSDGFIWLSSNHGVLARISTAGSVTTHTITGTPDFTGNLESDGSGGIWVGSSGGNVVNYDSSASVITTISDTKLTLSAALSAEPNFALDSSFNIYGLIRDTSPSNPTWKVRKWDASGTVQWTSGSIGWTSLLFPRAIAVDGSYIFIGGVFVP